ncbi:hypothetical protein [Reticulibacter mediterranei]|uniref:hypothetical protein n=1 Tax=Reticulibacter mediterranei TaxID=2778369 RepID=UPI001C688CA3|nr:hypothetical protein [Reticulibacter mediterranei]
MLLGWALQEEEAVQARLCLQEAGHLTEGLEALHPACLLIQSGKPTPISEWLLAVLCLDQIRGSVAVVLQKIVSSLK